MTVSLRSPFGRIRPASDSPAAYAGGVAIVLAALLARLALQPLFGADHVFTVFYPGVIVAASVLGARPAVLTAVLSAGLGCWAFAWKENREALAALLAFGITSSLSIQLIAGLRRALSDQTVARRRAEELAASHAELFRNLNERVTNHLQLVAALLQLQARDERDVTMARALAEASARTLLITRAHRSLDGEMERTLDFDAFARQLSDSALAAQGNSAVRVMIEPCGAQLGVDEATSVAIVLLECLQARLQVNAPTTMRVGLRREAGRTQLMVAEAGSDDEAPVEAERRLYLIEAMVEQLGGRFSSRTGAGEIVSELVFPAPGATVAVAASPMPSQLLH
jgi:two-component sensor histidine kinase